MLTAHLYKKEHLIITMAFYIFSGLQLNKKLHFHFQNLKMSLIIYMAMGRGEKGRRQISKYKTSLNYGLYIKISTKLC